MKFLLRNTETGLLYAGPDQWTNTYSEAEEFASMTSAMDIVAATKLNAMQVLMHFEDSAYEIPLTIVGLGA